MGKVGGRWVWAAVGEEEERERERAAKKKPPARKRRYSTLYWRICLFGGILEM